MGCSPLAAFTGLVAIILVASSSGNWPFDTSPQDWELPPARRPQDPHPDAPGKRARPLIAVVGLSRTGTSSVTAALEMLNLTVYHSHQTVEHHLEFWHYFLEGSIKTPDVRKLLDGVDGAPRADAVADCWYALLAPDILRAYPDAKFILTTRPVEGWLKSYDAYLRSSALYSMYHQWVRLLLCRLSRTLRLGSALRALGMVQHAGGYDLDKLPQLMSIWRRSDEAFYGSTHPSKAPGRWADAYARHQAHMRAIIPPSQLLEFDVTKGQGWRELLDFLRLPSRETASAAAQPFPHKYRSSQVASGGVSQESRRRTALHEAAAIAVALILVSCVGHFVLGEPTGPRPAPPKPQTDPSGVEYTYLGTDHARKPPTNADRLLAWWEETRLRLHVWFHLLGEYSKMRAVFTAHDAEGYFAYGAPGAYGDLFQHVATQRLLSFRASRGAGGADDEGSSGGVAPGGGFHSTLHFEDDGSVLPTYLPVEHGAGAALGALGVAAADLFELRTGEAQAVTVRRSDAGLATAAYLFIHVAPGGAYEGCDGFASTIEQEGKVNPVRKAYTCKDGRSVFLHGGFPKLKKGILDFFGGIEPKVEAIAKACADWDSHALEAAMQAAGLAATLCRTPREWRASPQGKVVAHAPLVDIDVRRASTGGSVRRLSTGLAVTRPLSDVLVLDFSHVIASPVVGRTLLDHGATVIKIVTHARPRRHLFDEEANAGKLTYELALDSAEGKAQLWSLLQAADVLIDGYTDGVLARHGFPVDEVLSRCGHLVYAQVACYGFEGPFAGKKGFQQNANFCAGVAGLEDEELMGYQLVSQIDYTTGFLGAFAIIQALTRRQLAAEAGQRLSGIRVRVSLCRTATWMAEYGADCPGYADYVTRITRLIWGCGDRAVTAGNMTYLPAPVSMSATPPSRVPGFNRWWREAKKYKL